MLIVKERTKTIDVDMITLLDDYANQRVIDELDS